MPALLSFAPSVAAPVLRRAAGAILRRARFSATPSASARAVPSRFKAPARRRADAEPSAPPSRNVPARTDGAQPPAPPPPPAAGGGGGFLSTVAEGFSFGIGTALARSLVDSVMGSMGGGGGGNDSGGGADAAAPPPPPPERSSEEGGGGGWGDDGAGGGQAQGVDGDDDEW